MQQISAVIITRNEERNIERCLFSIREVADEVIIVDAESTDRTVEIARRHGARVYSRPWTNYSDQKNHANSLARHPYILSMDADEALSPDLERELLRLKKEGFKGAYRFPRLTNYCGTWVRHGGWYPDRKIRLFPREGSVWEGEHVHEELRSPERLPVIDLKADLLHYSYHTITDHEERIERYSSLHAREMYGRGKAAGPIKLHLSPAFKFFQGYILQLGFLDGSAGYHIARLSARAVRLKYQKLKQLQETR